MTITEIIRQNTLPVRDRLSGFDSEIQDAEKRRLVAEECLKRASTEVTRQRTLETERNRALGTAASKVSEAQRILDDLEARRQEALEALTRCQNEYNAIAQTVREAQEATETALAEIRKHQRSKQNTDAEIVGIREKRLITKGELQRATARSLEIYIGRQIAALHGAFASQEQRSLAMREYEALKKARHTDAEVGRLCDERDEIRKLLASVVVPGVKVILEASLRAIEENLSKRFPAALQVADMGTADSRMEELLFYCNREGKAVCILPISLADWNFEEASADRVSKAMCLVWSIIKGLGLGPNAGDFTVVNGRPVFASQFELEDLNGQEFSVRCDNTEVIRFVFAAVPTDLREVLVDENQDA